MRLLSTVAFLLFYCVLPARHASARTAPASGRDSSTVKFIGEGGGYEHPSPEADDAMETGTVQEGGSGPAGSVPAPAPPQHQPTAGLPGGPRPHPAAPGQSGIRDAVPGDSIRSESERRRYSLWDGLAAPLDLPPEKVKDVSPDQAMAMGRRDYDTHILSQRQAPAGNAVPKAVSTSANASPDGGLGHGVLPGAEFAAPAPGPELFVTLNLDLKKNPAASLKDAVADLGRAVGFRQDMRFAPAAVGPGPDQVALWGWMPPGRVGEAMKVPAVARLEINPATRRAVRTDTATDVLVGVRVPAGSAADAVRARLERDLAVPGLRVKRAIGTQTAPGTGETVLVLEVSVPVGALSRLMAQRDVVKMVPAPPAAPYRPSREHMAELHRFLAYVMSQSPMLLVLTLLMLMPWVSDGLLLALRSFIPYR